MGKIKQYLVFVNIIFSIVLYTRSDDFCDDIYENYIYKSGTSQDKYLTDKLDKIINGEEQAKQASIKDLLRIIKKKRLGKCSVKFLDSVNTFINDYLQALGNNQQADEATASINKWIGNKINCLTVRNELNLKLKVKIPSKICEIDNCHTILLELSAAFGGSGYSSEGSKELLLMTFLELFWANYHTPNKTLKNKVLTEWTEKVCGGINYIKDLILKEGNVIDSRSLIDNEDFKRSASDAILLYFGKELLPKCGKPCIYKVMEIASKRTLECSLRSELLKIVSNAYIGTDKNIDIESEIKLFATFEKLTKDKCYEIQFALSDLLLSAKLKLYENEKIMSIVMKRILTNVKGYSEEERFLKSDLVSGFINVSDKVESIQERDALFKFFEKEFETTKDYDYKELLLRALFAFNRYKYILKNEKKLFEEFKTRVKERNIKSLISTQSDFYTNTLLQIAAIYGLESFRSYIEKNVPGIIKNFEQSSTDDDKKYLSILLAIYGYNDKSIEEYLMGLLKGITPTMVKQYALRTLFYNSARKELVNNYLNKLFENPDVGCLSYLASAVVGDVTALKKIDNLEECEKIKLSTKAVRELLKLSLDKDWRDKIKSNQDAINIKNLNLTKSNKFVTYDTCNVGHNPIGTPPTFLKNVVYGLECEEICTTEGCYCSSCNKLAFTSSLLYLSLNSLKHYNFSRKLEENTADTVYRGKFKNIMRKIGRELNATISFGALKKGQLKYILDFFSAFTLPSDKQLNKSISSYKALLAKISERFLVTFVFFKGKESGSNFIKVLPFDSASIKWNIKLNKIFTD